MRTEIHESDLRYRVAATVVEIDAEQQLLTLDEIVRRNPDLPKGHVRDVLGSFPGVIVNGRDGIGWTKQGRENIEACAAMRVVQHVAPSVRTVHNNVNIHGGNNMAAAGGDVTGTMNVTYEQVLKQLERKVETSDLPTEKKSEALEMLKGFVKTAGSTIIKCGVEVGTKRLLEP